MRTRCAHTVNVHIRGTTRGHCTCIISINFRINFTPGQSPGHVGTLTRRLRQLTLYSIDHIISRRTPCARSSVSELVPRYFTCAWHARRHVFHQDHESPGRGPTSTGVTWVQLRRSIYTVALVGAGHVLGRDQLGSLHFHTDCVHVCMLTVSSVP